MEIKKGGRRRNGKKDYDLWLSFNVGRLINELYNQNNRRWYHISRGQQYYGTDVLNGVEFRYLLFDNLLG
jgi:hypothetical protein